MPETLETQPLPTQEELDNRFRMAARLATLRAEQDALEAFEQAHPRIQLGDK